MPTENSATEHNSQPKYRALYVRQKPGLSGINWLHKLEDEIVAILKNDFDLTVIDFDFDYGEICDKYLPDLVIFESPGGTRSIPLNISNINACPGVPRVAFTNNQDPHDTSRVSLLRMMDAMRIKQAFSIAGAATMRQSPELMGRIFPTPQYFDASVFKDYGLEKIVPVTIFGWGAAPEFYNWRTSIVHEIYNYFPTLVYTHPSYTSNTQAHRFPISGEDYAKMINRSRFSAADTTRLDYVVRKHLEIPASGAVLISSPTPDTLFYGFRDLENCIMGSGTELYQKMAHVATNPRLYESIRMKGHELVHARYSRDKWHWIRDWYTCYRSLKPGETVQQHGVFGPFAAVPGGAEVPAVAGDFMKDSEFSLTMRAAWNNIVAGERLQEAEQALTNLLGWLTHLSEPYMLLGVIALLRSEPSKAKEMFIRPYQIRCLREQNNTFYDPEELVWLAMTAVLMNDGNLTRELRAAAEGVRFLGLRRLEWLFQTQGRFDEPPTANVTDRKPDDALSVHWTGQVDIINWQSLMSRIMSANQ